MVLPFEGQISVLGSSVLKVDILVCTLLCLSIISQTVKAQLSLPGKGQVSLPIPLEWLHSGVYWVGSLISFYPVSWIIIWAQLGREVVVCFISTSSSVWSVKGHDRRAPLRSLRLLTLVRLDTQAPLWSNWMHQIPQLFSLLQWFWAVPQAWHVSHYHQKLWSFGCCGLGAEEGSDQRKPSSDPGAGSWTSFLLEGGSLWSVLRSLPFAVSRSFSSGSGTLVC